MMGECPITLKITLTMSTPIKIFGYNPLVITVPISLMLHAGLYAMGFRLPDIPSAPKEPILDIRLVNPSNDKLPIKADFIANSNQQGSGDTKDESKITSPNAAKEANNENGDELLSSERTVKKVVEKLEPELLTTKGKTNKLINKKPKEEQKPEEKTEVVDNSEETEAIAKLMVEMSEQEERYAKRPRIRFIDSLSTKGSEEAEYIINWSKKMERIGNINFPQKALDLSLSGTLILNTTLDRAGRAVSIDISVSSGSKILDQAAIKIVKLASPYEPLPKQIRAKYDRLNITRTIIFHKKKGEKAKFYSK